MDEKCAKRANIKQLTKQHAGRVSCSVNKCCYSHNK